MSTLAQVSFTQILIVIFYLGVIGYLGYLGWRRTQTASDYLIAGRQIHPFIMAMSYGATFISTSAIVGFGGVAGHLGMGILWLVFLNIFLGIFVAFVFIAPRTRRLGHQLDAHTFPELLGKRYASRFVQVFAGLVIFLFIPLYAAAVLIGACKFIAVEFGVGYEGALLGFGAVIALYVILGGLKGVMYTDALQGSIMIVAMAILLLFSYVSLGGPTQAHRALSDLEPLVPQGLRAIGHEGWTGFPGFGWGDVKYNLWWLFVSTIILGVGIGVLAQPQLAVRFMTVRSRRELNRAVLLGGIFILAIPGSAYVVGSVSNAWFTQQGQPLEGQVVRILDAERNLAMLEVTFPPSEPGGAGEVKQLHVKLTAPGVEGQSATGRAIAFDSAGGDVGQIIPTFINQAMPPWFRLLFLLTLLAAAMSTLSSQFHALGTSISRDVYECLAPARGQTMGSIGITRLGVLFGILLAVTISYFAKDGGYIIARATAIFFGLCVSTFLPAFVGGLFFKGMTRRAAIASMIVGFATTAFWLTFIKAKEADEIGLVKLLTGQEGGLLADYPNWPVVDPVVIALPISILVAVVISALGSPGGPRAEKAA